MIRLSSLPVRSVLVAVMIAAAPTLAFAQRTPPPPVVSLEVVSDLQVRVQQLEQANQQLTGELEELHYQNQQLTKQLEGLQDDLTLRLSRLEGGGAVAPSGAAPALSPMAPAPTTSMTAPAPSGAAPQTAPGVLQGFDANAPLSAPVARQPSANTAPSPLVTAPQSGDGGFSLRTDAAGRPLPADPNAPAAPVAQAPQAVPRSVPSAAPSPGPVTSNNLTTAPASVALPQGTPKQQYDSAFEFVRRQDYAHGEAAMRAFVKQNPKDPLAGNAQYWLGETIYARGDYQTAAMEFMNGYQQYPKSNKGPDNLLKLGMALAQIKQTQGACTALGRIAKEYPDAPDQIRKTAQSERTKLKCT